MIVLVSGGCKNGKSSFSERLIHKIARNNVKYYIATMVVCDDEDKKRVENHRKNRADLNFETIEVNTSLKKINSCVDNAYYLFDSVTAYVLNHIFATCDVKAVDFDEKKVIINIKNELDKYLFNGKKNIIFVTDYIFSDIYNDLSIFTKKYMKCLADVCIYIANKSDILIDIKYNNHIIYKGKDIYEKILSDN